MNLVAYHRPVLLDKSVELLVSNPDGTYVDCTFGGGGHSRKILENLSEKGRLLSFDQDEDAWSNQIEDSRFVQVKQNFRHLARQLRFMKIDGVDGVLADLGISSHQIDNGERGFSTRFMGPLDMRMNRGQSESAADILNNYSEEKLASLFKVYGELRGAYKLARTIAHARSEKPFETTEDLKSLITPMAGSKRNQFFAQVFQALRIEVNDELGALKDLLSQSGDVVKTTGRLVVISYHSLEDRLVKRFIRNGLFEGEPERDVYGNWESPFHPLQNKVILPNEQETEENPRARSARLRVGIKNEWQGQKTK